EATASDADALEPRRLEAIELLGYAPWDRVRAALTALLDPRQTQAVQVATLRALADRDDPEGAAILLGRWDQLTPPGPSAAVEALLPREPWTLAMLRAARSGRVALPHLERDRRELLLRHKNRDIAALAGELFGDRASAARDAVLADYAPALKLAGDP